VPLAERRSCLGDKNWHVTIIQNITSRTPIRDDQGQAQAPFSSEPGGKTANQSIPKLLGVREGYAEYSIAYPPVHGYEVLATLNKAILSLSIKPGE
jgi:hypothetical protein